LRLNFGSLTTRGVDAKINYRLPIDNFGSVMFNLEGTRLINLGTQQYLSGDLRFTGPLLLCPRDGTVLTPESWVRHGLELPTSEFAYAISVSSNRARLGPCNP
jgi:hypothetical protein